MWAREGADGHGCEGARAGREERVQGRAGGACRQWRAGERRPEGRSAAAGDNETAFGSMCRACTGAFTKRALSLPAAAWGRCALCAGRPWRRRSASARERGWSGRRPARPKPEEALTRVSPHSARAKGQERERARTCASAGTTGTAEASPAPGPPGPPKTVVVVVGTTLASPSPPVALALADELALESPSSSLPPTTPPTTPPTMAPTTRNAPSASSTRHLVWRYHLGRSSVGAALGSAAPASSAGVGARSVGVPAAAACCER